MGVHDFSVTVAGATADDAFAAAVWDAQCVYGDDGFTGSIAEKTTFELFEALPPTVTADQVAYAMAGEETDVLTAWFGPVVGARLLQVFGDDSDAAVCLPDRPGSWLFCGLAST
jgi:hypothetical protein